MASGGYNLVGGGGGSPEATAKAIMKWAYLSAFGTGTVYVEEISTAATNAKQYPVPFACTARNLRVRAGTPPGTTHTIDFTVQKNGVDTALTCQLTSAGATASDVTHSVAFAAGDTITLKAFGANAGVQAAAVCIMCELTG